MSEDFRDAVLRRRRAWTDEMDEDEPRRPVTRSQTRTEPIRPPPPQPPPRVKKVVFAAPPPPPPPPTPVRQPVQPPPLDFNDDDDDDEEDDFEEELPQPPPPLPTATPNTTQAIVPPPLAPEMQLPAPPPPPPPPADVNMEAKRMCRAALGVDVPAQHPRYKALRDAWTALGGWSGGANMLGGEAPGLTPQQIMEINEKEEAVYEERMAQWLDRVGPFLIDENSSVEDMTEFIYIMQAGYAANDIPSLVHYGAIYDQAGLDGLLVNINRLGFSSINGQAAKGDKPEGENQRAFLMGFYPLAMLNNLAYHLQKAGYTVAAAGRVWDGKDAQDTWLSDSINKPPDHYASKKMAHSQAAEFLPRTRGDDPANSALVREYCSQMALVTVIGGWGVQTLWDDVAQACAQATSEFDMRERVPPEKQRHYQALPSPPATQPIAEAAVVAAATKEPEVKPEIKVEVKKEPEPAPVPAPAAAPGPSPPPAAIPIVANSLRNFIDDMILMPDWIFEQRQPTAQEDEQRNVAMASLSSAWLEGLTREYGEPELSRLLGLEAEHVMSHVRKIDWDNSPVMFYCVMRKVEIDRNIIRHVRVEGMDALDKEIFNVARVEAARMLKNIEAVRRQIILSRQPAYTPPSSVYHKAKAGESFKDRGESGDRPGLHGQQQPDGGPRPVRFSSSSPPGGPPPPTTPPGGGRPVAFSSASNPPQQPRASPQRPANFGQRMAALRAGEKAQAMQKARDYWARHPNAEKPDKRKTAKLVYKAAKYTPKKNDFPGVDTRAVGVREGVVRRARRT